jgi:hypothetical protein
MNPQLHCPCVCLAVFMPPMTRSELFYLKAYYRRIGIWRRWFRAEQRGYYRAETDYFQIVKYSARQVWFSAMILVFLITTVATAHFEEWYRWFDTSNPCALSLTSPLQTYEFLKWNLRSYRPYIDVVIADGRSKPGLSQDQVNVCLRRGNAELQRQDCQVFFRSMASCRKFAEQHGR